jgi:hypothetical protein
MLVGGAYLLAAPDGETNGDLHDMVRRILRGVGVQSTGSCSHGESSGAAHR